MKRTLKILGMQLLAIIILIGSFSQVSVSAASATYNLSLLGLKVTVPSGYLVITRDTPASDSVFDELGITRSEIISLFKERNIYLNAISDEYDEEIVVTMSENSIKNFTLFSDAQLKEMMSDWIDQFEALGIKVSKYEIYHHSQAKFLKIYYTDTTKSVHAVQYYTIYDSKAMNFTMRSYTGSLSSRQEKAIKKMVDSIKYNTDPLVLDQSEYIASFSYTDPDSKATFTVPKNWKQKELSQSREYIDIKFVSTKVADGVIIYGSTDIWEQLPESDKIGSTRADIDNSIFTKADVAEIYNTTEDKISTVTYNGVEYYQGETKNTAEVYGLDISVTMTQLIYIRDGWMYMFQVSGTSKHECFSDFESLMNSVQYPTRYNSDSGLDSDGFLLEENDTYDSGGIIAIIAVGVMIAIVIIAVVISRRRENKAMISQNSAVTDRCEPIQERPSSISPEFTEICRNCGQSLPPDSEFCHICGTRIEK